MIDTSQNSTNHTKTSFMTDQEEIGYIDSELLSKLSRKALAVCQIVLESGQGGTGFLIGKNLIMTNHHVIRTKDIAMKAQALFFHTTNSQKVKVALDPASFFYTSPAPTTDFECITAKSLDFTIVGIKSKPKITEIQHLAFSIFHFNGSKQLVGTYANIIHHPLEKDGTSYQKVSFRDNVIKSFCMLNVHYTTLTKPGSSGAPVIDDGGNLIALHRSSCAKLLEMILGKEFFDEFLNELFPNAHFKNASFTDPQDTTKQYSGRCAQIQSSSLYIFSKGEFKGKYFHEKTEMKEPEILLKLIAQKHPDFQSWMVQFLTKQGKQNAHDHKKCNTAISIQAIKENIEKAGRLSEIEELYNATQKDRHILLKENYLQQVAFLPLFLTNEAFPIESFFTQLSIISQDSQEEKEKIVRKSVFKDSTKAPLADDSESVFIPSLEQQRSPSIKKDSLSEIHHQLYAIDNPIKIETLFDSRNEKSIKRF